MLKLPVRRATAYTAWGVLLAGGLLSCSPFLFSSFLPDDIAFGWAPMIGVAIACPAFLWLVAFVRCTGCGYRLFWHALSKMTHPQGLRWFLTAERCPNCGLGTGESRRS